MSETTDKNQVDGKIDTKQSYDSTWQYVITYARQELTDCHKAIPLNSDDPSQILNLSIRLKLLADMLDRLVNVHGELAKLQDIAVLNRDKP